MSGQTITFEEWCKALDEHHEHLRQTEDGFEGYGAGSLIEQTGAECWRSYYDDDFSPEDALSEDRSYWED